MAWKIKAMIRTAVDLFSGIGGFSLAAEANGIEVLCHVEIDRDCGEYLRRRWPNVPVHRDIKAFDAGRYANADLVMGGPPCQPISCAGKRKGQEDDRWLWNEALKVVEVVQPRWCLFESPSAIRNMGLDGIISHLESLGYTCGTVDIPACAVDAPHLRQRYWIIACLADTGARHDRKCPRSDQRTVSRGNEGVLADSGRRNSGRKINPERGPQRRDADERTGEIHMADSGSERQQERGMGRHGSPAAEHERPYAEPQQAGEGHMADGSFQRRQQNAGSSLAKQGEHAGRTAQRDHQFTGDGQGYLEHTQERTVWTGQRNSRQGEQRRRKSADSSQWSQSVWTPCADWKVRRTPDSAGVLDDGTGRSIVETLAEEGWPKRSVLKALGNSIVWPVAAKVIAAMCLADGN